jgi:uncharacterized protein (DUF697 family)
MGRAVRYHEVGSTLLAPLRSDRESGPDRERMRGMQTDALELEQRADRIVLKYSVVGGAWNLLPMPFDVMGATGTFSKMATELASVYGVMIPGARARQIGTAIATGTASVMGVSYLGSKLLKFIPGYGFGLSLLVQAPVVGVISFAAGETLKDYFRKAKEGRDLTIREFQQSFMHTLKSKIGQDDEPIQGQLPAATATNGGTHGSDAVDQLKRLHELYQTGVVTESEYEAKKTELLTRI